jgi:hypothetical protein
MINPVESVNSGRLVVGNENRNELSERVETMLNPIIRQTSRTIKTESGYTIILPPQNIGGPKIEIEKLGGGYYMVLKTPVYYGAQTEKIIMTEKELIKEFNGFRHKQDALNADMKKILTSKEPYDYIRTKSGYLVKMLNGNNVTGARTELKEQPDGTYLVISYAYPGCPSKQEILTERELVAKYNAEKDETQDKIYNLVA